MSDAGIAAHLGNVLGHLDDAARRHVELAFANQLIPTGRLGILLEEALDGRSGDGLARWSR